MAITANEISAMVDRVRGGGSVRAALKEILTTVSGEMIAYGLGVAPVGAVADLNQDISAAYVEAEVQAISDKVDAILAALRTLGLVEE